MAARILILDDDQVFRRTLERALSSRGYQVWSAERPEDAIRLVSQVEFHCALIDMRMPGMNGLEVIRELKEIRPSIKNIILTGYASIEDAVKTIKLGGYHYMTKPCNMEEIDRVLGEALKNGAIRTDPSHINYHGIVGISSGIKKVIRLIELIKDMDLPVLICGESGTGKELVARAIHKASQRKDKPFIAINCASLKPELLENELFGHTKGAFTGAVDNKEGLVSMAKDGTLFIDEIGDMNLVVQASLLRFIETGTFRPLGSAKEHRVDTRIVAAINKDIEEEVRKKHFREDLYYRLNVYRINIPPLRERREDIEVLARYFVARFSELRGIPIGLSDGAVKRLLSYSWPGNVRELFHLLERVCVLNRDATTITRAHIEEALGATITAAPSSVSPLKESEKRHILSMLKLHRWNITQTARALGIDRRTLQRKIKQYGLRRD